MKRRRLVEMVLAVSVATAVLVFVATASAGQVTKIMYAQENSDVYSYPNTSGATGTLSVSIGWTDIASGVATTFPVGQVDGDIFSGSATGPWPDPYNDLIGTTTVGTLDEGTNPEVGSYSLPANQTAYIAVLPFVGDTNYTIDVKFNGTEVTGFPKTAPAYAASGEVYVPSDGDWISCTQYWPGTDSLFYASWYDQVYQRVAPAGAHDTLSEQRSSSYVAPQITQRTLIGGSGFPQSSEWYTVAPQIWPGAAVQNGQNVIDAYGNAKPGTVSATTAPLWYTYSYPDDSVTGNPVAYFWGTNTSVKARQRNYSVSSATKASFSARFSGDSVTWLYTMGKGYGIANVSIDHVSKGQVDQYNNGFLYQQSTTYSGLGAGDHTITVSNSGTKNTAATNMGISSDAFVANGIDDATDPTPVLENNYDGQTTYQWGKNTSAKASGGDYSAESGTTAALAFEFSGSSITWLYTEGKGYGIANVYIDGVSEGQVDQYNNGFLYQQGTTYSGLADTTHIILITNSGTKNSAATNMGISNDAFVVGGTTYEN